MECWRGNTKIQSKCKQILIVFGYRLTAFGYRLTAVVVDYLLLSSHLRIIYPFFRTPFCSSTFIFFSAFSRGIYLLISNEHEHSVFLRSYPTIFPYCEAMFPLNYKIQSSVYMRIFYSLQNSISCGFLKLINQLSVH